MTRLIARRGPARNPWVALMRQLTIVAAMALTVAGCAGTGPSSSSTPSGLSPADAALHARAVAFDRNYAQRWHVNKDTADCVNAWMQADTSDRRLARAL